MFDTAHTPPTEIFTITQSNGSSPMLFNEAILKGVNLPVLTPSQITLDKNFPLINLANLKPKNIIFHPPATIVYWMDGTKTVVKTSESCKDFYDKEYGLAMAYVKKIFGNRSKFLKTIKKYKKD